VVHQLASLYGSIWCLCFRFKENWIYVKVLSNGNLHVMTDKVELHVSVVNHKVAKILNVMNGAWLCLGIYDPINTRLKWSFVCMIKAVLDKRTMVPLIIWGFWQFQNDLRYLKTNPLVKVSRTYLKSQVSTCCHCCNIWGCDNCARAKTNNLYYHLYLVHHVVFFEPEPTNLNWLL
jgi:hypothetical protein